MPLHSPTTTRPRATDQSHALRCRTVATDRFTPAATCRTCSFTASAPSDRSRDACVRPCEVNATTWSNPIPHDLPPLRRAATDQSDLPVRVTHFPSGATIRSVSSQTSVGSQRQSVPHRITPIPRDESGCPDPCLRDLPVSLDIATSQPLTALRPTQSDSTDRVYSNQRDWPSLAMPFLVYSTRLARLPHAVPSPRDKPIRAYDHSMRLAEPTRHHSRRLAMSTLSTAKRQATPTRDQS